MAYDTRIEAANDVATRVIPVWSRSLGSWTFSLGRKPFESHELEGHYDKEADTWHETISRLGFEDAYANLIEQALSSAPILAVKDALQVLDAGIGTGAMSAALADTYLDPIALTGVDVSGDMLKQAEQRLDHSHLSTRFLQADVNCLPFADNTFDVVLVAHVLEHMAYPKRALAELHRVLKPGGILVACVTQRSSAGVYIQLKWRTHRVDTSTVREWLWDCGFVHARAVALQEGTRAQRFSCGYIGQKAYYLNQSPSE
ncbi:class I SAM-dependent methyltransferase [Jannaschia pohangensis]|uniref:Demethylmenaquinone methyltransferase / 2-methoxy-6-polyprenyl-1,4-benzoquinol methylase n=1 Tax=Jannaschia pohangensis TaxID=390807 RepID=A0A1I3UWZ5_9RHOB|nr:methyltransferase domain-containing protein [Jannaschia pohangensis]SFJ87243.1 demethylmenaquinone methyltransferase / 2-methoxy-6-polyprenyl-1,4-benzoquinol methylase [Jannaschia pohangensis]